MGSRVSPSGESLDVARLPPSALVIHLDQKDWIDLARGYYGKDPGLSSISQEVARVSDVGNAIFPLSHTHFDETVRRLDEPSRKRLAEFMTKVSKGWSILPATRIIEAEIESACLKILGGQGYDLGNFAIKKNLSHMFGTKGQIVDRAPQRPVSQELKDSLLQRVNSVEALLFLMNLGPDDAFLKERLAEARIYVEETERIRLSDSRIVDKELRHKATLAKYLIQEIFPKTISFLLEIGFDPKAFAIEIMADEASTIKFLQSIPTAYCIFELDFCRNMQLTRKIQPNDMNDIMSLSIALPYSDVVVTERMWHSVIVDKKLDQLRPTKVLASVEEMTPILARVT